VSVPITWNAVLERKTNQAHEEYSVIELLPSVSKILALCEIPQIFVKGLRRLTAPHFRHLQKCFSYGVGYKNNFQTTVIHEGVCVF
jgi:hypothetical protein